MGGPHGVYPRAALRAEPGVGHDKWRYSITGTSNAFAGTPARARSIIVM